MTDNNPGLKSRAAFTSTFIALASVSVALSAILVASIGIKIILIVVAMLLLGAAGAHLALVIARAKPPLDR
jgi:hypothetical protein